MNTYQVLVDFPSYMELKVTANSATEAETIAENICKNNVDHEQIIKNLNITDGTAFARLIEE